jgi:protein-disulfide isomerase
MPKNMNHITASRPRQALGRFRRVGRWAGGFALLILGLSCAQPLSAPPNTPLTDSAASAPTRAPATSTQVAVASDDALWGNVNAPVTVVAFLDFQCPFCAQAHPTLVELLHKYGPDKLRLVIKHAPLPFHERGMPAAKAAQTVLRLRGVDRFLDYVGALYSDAMSDRADKLSDSRLLDMATALGIDSSAFAVELGKPEVAAKVNADLRQYGGLGLQGVPSFLINGAELTGARPVGDFETLIDHELTAAQELARRGVDASAVYERRVQVNYRPPAPAVEEQPFESVAYQVPLGTSPSRGPADAPITIVEFADFECPFCARVHATIERLFVKYPGKVRWVMKHNPLPFHPVAIPATITALEIRRQKGDEAYWTALARFYGAEQLTPDLLLTVADELGVAEKPLLAAFEAQLVPAELQADRDLAVDLNAQGTPHFFVNGRRLAGAQPFEVFDELVTEEFAKVSERKLVGDVYAALQDNAAAPPGLSHHDVPPPGPETPALGPNDAPIVIQMFSDFECPFCQRVLPTIATLRARYPGKVKLVWRHLPLAFHPHAKQAAAAALEARAQLGDQGFWLMVERLMGMPGVLLGEGKPVAAGELPELNVEFLRAQAKAIGLDESKFLVAMNGAVHHPAIAADEQIARKLGVHGTPSFFINGYALSGAQPLERFERLVRLALTPTVVFGDKSPRTASSVASQP